MFTDRLDAGRQLADELEKRGIEADIVLAIPRGGLPLGRVVADRLGAPLDVVVAKKIGAPHNPEFALGAVAADGSAWLNDEAIQQLDVDQEYVETEREREAENAREKAMRYRGETPTPDLSGKRVVVVDDGVATGSTAVACLRHARSAGADHLVLAVPVGSPRALSQLEAEADEVVFVDAPQHFHAVGQFYDVFAQVSDEEAIEYLEGEGPDR